MKNFLRDLVVIVFLAVVLAVAILFFSGSIKVHAAPILYTPRTLSETRGKVTVTTCDAHTLYEYHNDDYHPCSTMQPAQARTARNTPIAVTTPNVPNVPVIEEPTTPQVIDDNGETLPDDTVTEEPTTEEPTITENGNPGNGKNVGKSGEKCDKSMCENADGVTGEKGKSNND